MSFKHSVSQWCFPQLSIPALARAAKEMDIESVELLEPNEWALLKPYGAICAMSRGCGTITENFNRRENHAALVIAFEQRIRECAAAGVPNIVCFSGNRYGHSDEEGLEICVEGFRQIAPLAERAGVTLCLELLNSKVDHPGYQCDSTAWGVEVCERVGSERVKLLFDIYHMGVMGEDVIAMIRQHHRWFAHYHTAGVPGRHEIDASQQLDYPAIMRAIKATGFKGYVGHEFLPAHDPLTSLKDAVRICTV